MTEAIAYLAWATVCAYLGASTIFMLVQPIFAAVQRIAG